MSKTQNLIHIVFATKNRQNTITEEKKKDLYNYIYGVIKNNNCFLHKLGGISNHIHMLIDLHPSVALSGLVKDIKLSSNQWLKSNPDFPYFTSWAEGYFAASIGAESLNACKLYIANQPEHHYFTDINTELEKIMLAAGLQFHPDDLK